MTTFWGHFLISYKIMLDQMDSPLFNFLHSRLCYVGLFRCCYFLNANNFIMIKISGSNLLYYLNHICRINNNYNNVCSKDIWIFFFTLLFIILNSFFFQGAPWNVYGVIVTKAVIGAYMWQWWLVQILWHLPYVFSSFCCLMNYYTVTFATCWYMGWVKILQLTFCVNLTVATVNFL